MRNASMTMDELLTALPSPSAVALEVIAACGDDGVGLDDLVRLLGGDPALVARILAEANTARYGSPRSVATLERAALLLGARTLRSVALTFVVVEGLPRSGAVGGMDLPRFWTRSIAAGTAARAITTALGRTGAEEAFLAGLLGDIGRLGLAIAEPEMYESLLVHPARPWPTASAEHAAFGIDSAEFGSRMLAAWNLPELYVWAPLAAVGHPPTPVTDEAVRRAAPILLTARLVAGTLTNTPEGGLGDLYEHAERVLGLGARQVDAQLERFAEEVVHTGARLGMELSRFEIDLLHAAAEAAGMRLAGLSGEDG
jgi:two-component system cell cycle response regulator